MIQRMVVMEENSKTKKISSHTFILPLKWDVVNQKDMKNYLENPSWISLETRLDMNRVAEALLADEKSMWRMYSAAVNLWNYVKYGESDGTKDCAMPTFVGFTDNEKAKPLQISLDLDDKINLYKESVFFYDHIRRIIYNNTLDNNTPDVGVPNEEIKNAAGKGKFSEASVLVCSRVFQEPSTYTIKGTQYGKDKEYQLSLKNIQARFYKTGVALLSFHCVNDTYKALKDIGAINALGRRLYASYFKPKGDGKSVTLSDEIPRSVEICFGGGGQKIELFEGGKDRYPYPEYYSFFPKLLGERFVSYRQADSERASSGKPDCQVILDSFNDDRMFVHSWIIHEPFAEQLAAAYQARKDRIGEVEIRTLLKYWNALLFADRDIDSSSVQSVEMLQRDLERHTYDRWIGYSSIYGITNSTFLFVAKNDEEQHLFDTFDWNYFQMTCIALLYKNSILRYYEEASGVLTIKAKRRGTLVDALHQSYMFFLNCVWFHDITAQYQGQELFEMLTTYMQIDKDVALLDRALDEMQRAESSRAQDTMNKILYAIAFLGFVFAFVELISTFSGLFSIAIDICKTVKWMAITIVCGFGLYFLSKKIFKPFG